MSTSPLIAQCLEVHGYYLAKTVLDMETTKQLSALLSGVSEGSPEAGSVYARRDAFSIPEVLEAVRSGPLFCLARSLMGPGCRPVKGIFFDKHANANWKVPRHQDLTIAVEERKETPGFGNWSMKGGFPHTQPPVAILERMLTLRLHLDPCNQETGALRVIPGSHRFGRLDQPSRQQLAEGTEEVTVTALPGDVLLMKPLLLHASSPGNKPLKRGILHIEYASQDLPEPLCWPKKY